MKLKVEKEFELTGIEGPYARHSALTINEYHLFAKESITGQEVDLVLVLGYSMIEVLSEDGYTGASACSTETFIAHQFLENVLKDSGVNYSEELQADLKTLWRSGFALLEPRHVSHIGSLISSYKDNHSLTYPQ